jgi:DNA processing protein
MDAVSIHRLAGGAVPPALAAVDCTELFVQGTLPRDTALRVAIVGTRRSTASGESMAYELACGLARAGVVVVSGLAQGIDSAAHRGALDGGGATVAFLGASLDMPLPVPSRRLAALVVGSGALVSEYPPRTPARPFRFVRRNRLVAAYTIGTVVVECGVRSGALITAGFAAELSREVWAVPGDPRRPTSQGSNRLLREGVGCVLDARDLLAALGLCRAGGPGGSRREPPPGSTPAERAIWRSLYRDGPADAETLCRRTALVASELLEGLSRLELGGHLRHDGEGFALRED